MTIKLVKNEKGASKYGTCNECGASSQEDEEMKSIRFNQVSVCLCTKCFNRFVRMIDLMDYFS